MKQLALAISLAASVAATPAMASTDNAIRIVDAQNVFAMADYSNDQYASLSAQEMKATDGAFLPLAPILIGAAFSAWTYHGVHYYQNGTLGSSRGALISAGAGAVGGAYTGGMLSASGISTSIFARSAWTATNAPASAVIRLNGSFLGNSWLGGYRRGM